MALWGEHARPTHDACFRRLPRSVVEFEEVTHLGKPATDGSELPAAEPVWKRTNGIEAILGRDASSAVVNRQRGVGTAGSKLDYQLLVRMENSFGSSALL